MSECDRIKSELSAYRDGALDCDTASAVDLHLENCLDCKKDYEELCVMANMSSFAQVDMPQGLHDKIMERVRLAAEQEAMFESGLQAETNVAGDENASGIDMEDAIEQGQSNVIEAEFVEIAEDELKSEVEMKDDLQESPLSETKAEQSDEEKKSNVSLLSVFRKNKYLAGLAVAACFVVVAIPAFMSSQNSNDLAPQQMTTFDSASADTDGGISDVDSGAGNAKANDLPQIDGLPTDDVAPSAFQMEDDAVVDSAVSEESNLTGNADSDVGEYEVEEAQLPQLEVGESAAAEVTVQEVLRNFSQESVRYFSEFTPNENFDLDAYFNIVGEGNIFETNLKYYILMTDESYNYLLNMVNDDRDIFPFEIGTMKLDPMAKNGIIVVLK